MGNLCCAKNELVIDEKKEVKKVEMDIPPMPAPPLVSNTGEMAPVPQEPPKPKHVEEEEITIPDKYTFQFDRLFENIESPKQLNFLSYIPFLDFAYSLTRFSEDNIANPDNYDNKPQFYHKSEDWFNVHVSKDSFQGFINNKIFKHHIIHSETQEKEGKANAYCDLLCEMYAMLNAQFGANDKNNGKEKQADRLRKYHLLSFGLVYCGGKIIDKVHFLFDLFKDGETLKESDEFKELLLAIFLVPSFCLLRAKAKLKSNEEIGDISQDDMKAAIDSMQLRDCVNLIGVTCRKIFASPEVTFDQFKAMFTQKDGLGYLIHPTGVRKLLLDNNV